MLRPCAALCLALAASLPAFAQSSEQDAREMADSINAFAIDLYRALPEQKRNRFFSPYSISVALGMTRAGAAGATAKEMDQVLHFPQTPLIKYHERLICSI